MESLAKITAAPKETIIGGKKEKLYPLRFMDWGRLEQWMRSCVIDAAKTTIEGVDRKEATIIMRSAHHVAAQISIIQCLKAGMDEEENTAAYLRNFEGMMRVLHLSLRDSAARDAKPVYSLSVLDELLDGDIGLLNTLFLEILDISFPTLMNESEATEAEKNL